MVPLAPVPIACEVTSTEPVAFVLIEATYFDVLVEDSQPQPPAAGSEAEVV